MNRTIMKASVLSAAGIVVAVLVIMSFDNGILRTLFAAETPKIGAERAPVQVPDNVKALNDAYISVSNAVLPTVVSISVEFESRAAESPFSREFREFFKFFGPFGDQQPDERFRSRGSGSGVIITSDGYIVTNAHVVENAVKDGIKITAYDKKVYNAKLIGSDPLTDLALLKIEASDLPCAHFASMDDVKVGEIVFAVGNPMGLNSTVTSGIISAIGRGQLNLRRDQYAVEYFIQTDAAINPGNSGGGLFNISGSLVGINSAIATSTGSYIGYGFAIPVDLAKAVIEDLIDDGEINRGYIGVKIRTVDEVEARSLGLDNVEGVIVDEVLKDSPAEKAGLEAGDVILEVQGRKVSSSNELQSQIVMFKAGDVVKLSIWRDKKKIQKNVKLEPRKQDESSISSAKSKKGEESEKTEPSIINFDNLGFSVTELTKETKKDLGVDNGAFISEVKRNSIAASRALATNGVITRFDKESVKSPKQLKNLIEAKKPGEAFMLQVRYKDNTRMIAIEIPSK